VQRLSGAGSETRAEGTSTDTGMVYTLRNLEIASGVTVTLNLSGTQTLDQGVYLYTADMYTDSQTFVGVSSGERQVNLSVDLCFETAQHSTSSKTTTQTDRVLDVSASTATKTDVTTETKTTETVQTNVNNKIYANVTVTEVTETQTGRDWTYERIDTTDDTSTPNTPNPTPNPTPTPTPTPSTPSNPTPSNPDSSDSDTSIPDEDPPLAELPDEDPPLAELPDEDVPLEDLPDEDVPLVDLPDEDVPLSDIPQTGDNSLLWVLLFVVSGFGLVYLVFSGKKREKI
jgi:hypothetical protein